MTTPTYYDIATTWSLWQSHADPAGLDTWEWFDSTPTDAKIEFLVACFGKEELA